MTEVAQMDAAGRLTIAIGRLAERDETIKRLRNALTRAIAFADAANHPDRQYADERPDLIREANGHD